MEQAFERRFNSYLKHNLKYFPSLKPWGQRYLDLMTPQQRKKPPTFGEFYFKGANKEEVLLTLNMLRLAVLQEALEIQQKIIYEK